MKIIKQINRPGHNVCFARWAYIEETNSDVLDIVFKNKPTVAYRYHVSNELAQQVFDSEEMGKTVFALLTRSKHPFEKHTAEDLRIELLEEEA